MTRALASILAAFLVLAAPSIAAAQQQQGPGTDTHAATLAELEPAEVYDLGALMAVAGLGRETAFYDVANAMPEGDRGNFAALLLSLGTDERTWFLDYLLSLDNEGQQRTADGFASTGVEQWQVVKDVLDARRPDLLGRVIGSNCRLMAQQEAPAGEDPVLLCFPPLARGINMRLANWAEAPFQAQLFRKGRSLADYYTPKMAREDRALRGGVRAEYEREHVCGAVYVGEQWLLTAAHCIGFSWDDRPGAFFDGRGIRLGTVSIENPGLQIPIDAVVRHAAYRDTLHGNDIALLRMARAPTREEIATLSLRKADLPGRATPPMRVGQALNASGWGLTGATDDTDKPLDRSGDVQMIVPMLRIGSIEYLAKSSCEANAHYKALAPVGFHMTAGQLCAGSEKQVDTCRGDSGGPLVWWRGASPVLVGLVSFGPGCGQPDTPGVYTNVRTYAANGWIAGAMKAAKAGRIVSFP